MTILKPNMPFPSENLFVLLFCEIPYFERVRVLNRNVILTFSLFLFSNVYPHTMTCVLMILIICIIFDV